MQFIKLKSVSFSQKQGDKLEVGNQMNGELQLQFGEIGYIYWTVLRRECMSTNIVAAVTYETYDLVCAKIGFLLHKWNRGRFAFGNQHRRNVAL